MQLENTVYQIIAREPTFEHQVQGTRMQSVADDFRTFTMPHVTHVCLANSAQSISYAVRQEYGIKKVNPLPTNLAKQYRQGGVRLARRIAEAFDEVNLDDFVFWLRARRGDNKSFCYYHFKQSVDELGNPELRINVVQYDYNVITSNFVAQPYRILLSDRLLNDLKELLTKGTLVATQDRLSNLLGFVRASNEADSFTVLATALGILEDRGMVERTRHARRQLQPMPYPYVMNDRGDYQPLPFSIKRIHSLDDLRFDDAAPDDQGERLAANANEHPHNHARRRGDVALHEVRGHVRHLKSGKTCFVRAHTRGNRDKLTIHRLVA
ncbi:MAG: hypothetical protein KGN33_02750 [Paracoccaceae bacterium]|nr:hypothetical protein [Paracoccaceae bacterium]